MDCYSWPTRGINSYQVMTEYLVVGFLSHIIYFVFPFFFSLRASLWWPRGHVNFLSLVLLFAVVVVLYTHVVALSTSSIYTLSLVLSIYFF